MWEVLVQAPPWHPERVSGHHRKECVVRKWKGAQGWRWSRLQEGRETAETLAETAAPVGKVGAKEEFGWGSRRQAWSLSATLDANFWAIVGTWWGGWLWWREGRGIADPRRQS